MFRETSIYMCRQPPQLLARTQRFVLQLALPLVMEPTDSWHQRLWIGKLAKATPSSLIQTWVPLAIFIRMYNKPGVNQSSCVCWFRTESDYQESLAACSSQGFFCRCARDWRTSSSSSSAPSAKPVAKPPARPPPQHLLEVRDSGDRLARDLYTMLAENRAFAPGYQTLVDEQNRFHGFHVPTVMPPWRQQPSTPAAQEIIQSPLEENHLYIEPHDWRSPLFIKELHQDPPEESVDDVTAVLEARVYFV